MSNIDYDIDDLFQNPELPEMIDGPGGSPSVQTLASASTPSNQNIFDVGPAASLDNNEFTGNTIMQDGYLRSSNFVTGVSGWSLEPESGEFNFSVSVDSLNIPDTTTANSFHVDSNGNSWWGANVATGYTGANAYILNTGAAVFKNIQIGGTTIQYVITNSGIFSFGDGSDGDVTISVDTTLTGDKYYDDLTINTACTLFPAGYRVFVKGTLTINGTGKISGDGPAGGAGTNGQVGTDSVQGAGGTGTALADGYLKGSLAGATGGGGGIMSVGPGGNGTNGTATTNSLGANSAAGGAGGTLTNGLTGTPGTGGTGATATASNVKLIANWHLATLLDVSSTGSTVKFNNSASAGGGGGGVGGSVSGGTNPYAGEGGAGGAGGTAGRIIAIYAKNIVIGASASITSNGGAGGAGGTGGPAYSDTGAVTSWAGGGGGGGGGGNGGIIILVYNTLTNSGSITANAGAGGAGGAGGTGVGTLGGTSYNGNPGSAGSAGAAGVIYQFQLSL